MTSAVAFLIAGIFVTSLGSNVARAEVPMDSPGASDAGTSQPPLTSPEATQEASSQPTEPPVQCEGGDTAGEIPAGTRSISGTVTNPIGDVVPDLQVRLALSTVGFSSQTTVTNAQGEYRFSLIGDASYLVSFFDQGGTYQSGFYDGGPLALTAGSATAVVLSGTDASGIDASLPAEQRFSISGAVTNSSGAGVDGVDVHANAAYFPVGGCDRTDVNGDYVMADVRLGAYRIQVDRAGYPSGFYRADVASGFTTHFSEATLVTVDSNLSGIDLQFPELFSLSGVVRDAGGSLMPGFNVAACEALPGACNYAVSDSRGEFTVDGLPAGDYHVRYSDSSSIYRSGWYAGDGILAPSESGAASVPVPGAAIELLADPAPTISGTIRDEDGVALDLVQVNLCDADSGSCFSDTTDGLGFYEAPIVDPGTYTAQVWDNTMTRPSGGYIQTDGSISPRLETVRTIPVSTSSVVDVNATLPDGGRITATVTSGGAPISGVYLQFCIPDIFCEGGQGDESGTVTSPALFVGTYFAQDGGTGYWLVDGGTATSSIDGATALGVTANGTVTITSDVPAVDAGTPTEPGTDVEVALDDGSGSTPVTLSFANVTAGGTSSLTVSETGTPVPDGFQLGLPATYYDISTTAEFSGQITVCVSYAGVTYADESGLRFYHFNTTTGSWEDITVPPVDTVNDQICGITSSLSPFVIIERTYVFGGFVGPKAPPTINGAKAGSTIGIKFSLGGDLGLGVFADGTPTVRQISCSTGDSIGAAAAATGTLKYARRTSLYAYSWVTMKTWKNTCRELTLTFRDGSSVSVWYRLKP
ncbi:MAG TPA: PxKF domain-containing protein [Candidatus Limnocylindria bacterium]|nr:PxKF domain-containing protein [Candidatus Limnocylindria bacterium]